MQSRKGDSINGSRILRKSRRPADPIKRPYVKAEISLSQYDSVHEIRPIDIAGLLDLITRVEGPVHLRVATRRIAEAVGATATPKAVLAVKRAVDFAKVRIRSDFLYPPNYSPSPVRDYSTAPEADRKLRFVPQLEIEEAIMETLRRSFKISEEDAIRHALHLLGFKKLTKNAGETMRQALRSLINRGRVTSENGTLSIQSP